MAVPLKTGSQTVCGWESISQTTKRPIATPKGSSFPLLKWETLYTTTARMLHQSQLYTRAAERKLWLSAPNVKWSDETSIEQFGPTAKRYDLCRPNITHHHEHTSLTVKRDGGSIMLRGCFSAAVPKRRGESECKEGGKWIPQSTEKSWRKTFCSLWEECNLGEDSTSSWTMTPNTKPTPHRNGLIKSPDLDPTENLWRHSLFFHGPHPTWQSWSNSAKKYGQQLHCPDVQSWKRLNQTDSRL